MANPKGVVRGLSFQTITECSDGSDSDSINTLADWNATAFLHQSGNDNLNIVDIVGWFTLM